MSSIAQRGIAIALMCLASASAAATRPDDRTGSWTTEPGVSPPSYALTEPVESDLNVDTVVLLCSQTPQASTIELDLYLSEPDFLLPKGADPAWLKDDPSVEIEVDGRIFRADLLFAEGYVIVADAVADRQPSLSTALLNALQHGETMVMRFDLLKEGSKEPRLDSRLVVDLRAGRAAIAAVRRCGQGHVYQATR